MVAGQSITLTRVGQLLTLDWGSVFSYLPDVPVVYSAVVGTQDGYTDVLDLDYSSGHKHEITIPSQTLLTSNPTELFIKITCTDITGLSTVYQTTYKL